MVAISLSSTDFKCHADTDEPLSEQSTDDGAAQAQRLSLLADVDLNKSDVSCRGARVEKEKLITAETINHTDTPAPGALQQYSFEPQGAVGTYNLGLMYAQGKGVAQDKAKAAKLYAKAHFAGSVKATYNLGLMYQRGDGVEKDSAKAAELYEHAHGKGYVKATYNLARMYERGEGVERDSVKATELFERLTKEKADVASLRKSLKKSVYEPVLVFNVNHRDV
jgi:TPR repeat protein